MNALAWIAERRVEQAIARGELSNLPGAGKPLPDDIDPLVPEEMRNVVRLLRRAGGLPQAIESLRALHAAEQEVKQAGCERKIDLLVEVAVLRARLERARLQSAGQRGG